MEPQVYQPFQPNGYDGTDDLLAMVRICAHFYANYGWLQDGELIHNAGALADIPGVLVHVGEPAGLQELRERFGS